MTPQPKTPEELIGYVRELLDGSTPYPWRFTQEMCFGPKVLYDRSGYLFGQIDDGQNGELIAAAPELLDLFACWVEECRKQTEKIFCLADAKRKEKESIGRGFLTVTLARARERVGK